MQAAFVDALAASAATDRCGLHTVLDDAPASGSLRCAGADWIWTREGTTFLVESAETVVRIHEPLHDPTAFDVLQWAIHTDQSPEAALAELRDAQNSGALVDTSVPELAAVQHRFRPIGLQPLRIPWLGPWHGNEGSVELIAGDETLEIDGAALPMVDGPFRAALGDFDPFVHTPDIGRAAVDRLVETLRTGARATLIGCDAVPAVTRPLGIHDLRWGLAEWIAGVAAQHGTLDIRRT